MTRKKPTPKKPSSTRVAAPRTARAKARRTLPPPPLPPPLPPPPPPEALDLLPADPPVLGDIPWGYGDNRVTAMAVDPHWVFVYWELTDEALARARDEVGAQDADCVLRVYDTTYRIFDGTNANWYTDVGVYRPANNHYVCVNRPGSTFHVDIGVKSREGYFAKIARSAPVEMPRSSISSDTRADWMTVAPEGAPPPEYQHRFVPRPGAPAPAPALALSAPEVERLMQSLAGEGWTHAAWTETGPDGRTIRWVRWTGPFWREHWQAIQSGTFVRVQIAFEGDQRVIRTEWGERLVLGPWHVTIHGLGAEGGRRLIDRWTVHYSWPTEAGALRIETAAIVQRILQGYRVSVVPAGSEVRLMAEAWASEALQMGASEWRWLGASERWLAGAAEVLWLGASEWGFLGASEWVGASEWRLGGASEWMFGGASELLGASEWLFPGASEGRLGGASEGLFPGASEGRT